jgi:hypothetical protein
VLLFANPPSGFDFDGAESAAADQVLELTPGDVTTPNTIGLKFVKFQNVRKFAVRSSETSGSFACHHLLMVARQIFVKTVHGNGDVAVVSGLSFIGMPVQATDMKSFQRVCLGGDAQGNREKAHPARSRSQERKAKLTIETCTCANCTTRRHASSANTQTHTLTRMHSLLSRSHYSHLRPLRALRRRHWCIARLLLRSNSMLGSFPCSCVWRLVGNLALCYHSGCLLGLC